MTRVTKPLPLLIVAVALLLFAPFAWAASGADHVKVDVLPDVAAVKAGQPFTVGVRLTIDPGWHVYWTNPGDSGLATKATVTAPAGFTVGPTQFPAPTVLPQAGGNVNYGYETEVMLLVAVTPPKTLPAGVPVTIKANALYLVCQETCLPGKGAASIDLPVATDAAPANAELFKQWAARMPVAADPDRVASVACAVDPLPAAAGNVATVTVVWKGSPPTDVQWVPDAGKGFEVSEPKTTTAGDTTRVTFHLKLYVGTGTRDANVNGLLIYSPAPGQRRALLTTGPIPVGGPTMDKK